MAKLTIKFRDAGADESTNPKKVNMESGALKSCCKNALVVSVMTLMDLDHKRLVRIVVQVSLPMREWHTVRNVELRDVFRTKAWLIEQLDKGLMEYFYRFFQVLTDVSALKKCCFMLPLSSDKLDGQDGLTYVLEDDFADYMGQFASSMCKQTMKRLSYMFSYPHFHIASLVQDPKKKEVLREKVRKHIETYKKFVEAEGKRQVQQVILDRHPFGTTLGKRCMEAFAEDRPQSMDDWDELVSEMAQGLPQTQIVEDIIGSQKNSKTVRNYTKVERPEVFMSLVVDQNILEQRHRYTAIDMNVPMVGSTPKIQHSAFNHSPSTWSHPWEDIAGPKQSPDWYSLAAQFGGAHYSDLDCLDLAVT